MSLAKAIKRLICGHPFLVTKIHRARTHVVCIRCGKEW